jgi:hypothetical protein
MKNQTLKNISDIRQLKIKLAKEEKLLKMKQDSLARIKIHARFNNVTCWNL